MASMLSSCIRSAGVRRVRGLYALPDRQIYACSCQHTPGHTSAHSSKGEQPTRRYVHHAKVFSTIPRPLAARGLWPYSHVYYRPEYHITCLRDPTSYNSCVIKHSLHTTAWLCKEDTVVEKSVKALKDEIEEQKSDGTSVSKSKDKKVTEEKPPEGFFAIRKAKFNATLAEMRKTEYLRYFWNAFKGFVLHYKDGFVLFWKNLKYCMPLLLKYLRQGRSSLKRREYNLLTKTLADLFRMVPLIPMVIIPLGEIFIPFYVKLGMMPSVFRNKTNTKEFKRQLQTKVEYAHLLTSSLQDIPLKKDGSGSSIHDFTDFMQKMKSTETIPTIDEITKFSTLFEDTITLDDLNIVQLQALGKLLGIGFLGKIPSAPVLRFQIMMKVRELEVDDKLIQKEGIESMTTEELQAANRARGMRGIGVSEDRLKMQILQWLELHLKRRVPTSLLLLSRVMYLDENLSPAEQLKQTISALPETTVDKVIVSSAESKGEAVDRKTKIKVLEEEHKAIVMEKKQEEEEKRQTEMAEKQTLEKKEEQRKLKAEEDAQALHTLHTVEKKHIDQELAKLLEERAAEIDPLTPDISQAELTKEAHVILEKEILHDVKVTQDIAKPIQDEEPAEGEADITAKDLGDIEKAIEDMAVHHKDELSEVKEDLDEYLEDMEDIKAICEDKAFTKRVNETKGAQTLRSHLNKYLNKLDSTISNIQDTKMQLQAKLEQQEVQLKYDLDGNRDELLGDIETKKGRLISINDVLLSLKRLQKTPDDVRMQQILQVLDTDEDGLIDINDVLKIERLAEAGEETVLLTASPDDESTGHLSSNNARKFVATKDANLFKDKFLNFLLDGPNEDVESLFKTNPGKKAFDSNAGTYSKLVHTKGLGPITASQSTLHKPASSHSTLPVKRQVDQASLKPPQPDAKRVKLDIAATAGKTGLQSSGIKSPLITNTTKNNQMSPSVVKGHQNLATLKAQAKPTLETTKVVSKSGGFTEERISNAQFRKFVEKYSRGEGACSEEGYSLQSPHTPSHLITPSRGNKSLGQISNTTSVSSSIKDNNSVELNSPHAASSQSGKQDSMQLAKTVKDIKSNSDNKLKVDSKHKTESGKVSPVHGTNSTKLNTDKSTKLKDGIKTKVDCQTASVSKPKVDIDSIKNIEDIDTETLIKMTKEKHLENMSEADKQINAKLGMLTSKMSWVVEYPDKAEKQAGRQPVPAPGDANHSAMMEIYEEMEEEDYDEEEDDEYDEEGLDEEDRAKLQAMREAGHKLAIDGQHPQSDFHAGAMAGQFCMTEDEYDEQGGYGDYATYNQAGQMVMMPNTLSEGHKGDEQLYQRCSSPYLDSFLMIGPMLAKCLVCNKMVRKTEAKQHSSLHQQEQEEQEESEGYSVEECDQVEGYGQYQDEEQFPTDGEYQAEQGQYSAEQGQYSAEQGQYSAEQGQYPTEQGEYPTGEEGEYPTGEEGEYQTEQGVYPVDEQGQYPAHNQGEYSAHNQGEYPAHEQGEYPAHENEEYPVDEEGEYSGEAEDEYDEEAPEYTAEKFVAEPLTAEKISDVGDASDNLFQDKSGKTLICDICNKICKTHSNMLRHRQTHTRTKDFPCPNCTKTFKLQINLTKHLQKAHPVHPEGTAALFNEVEDVFSPCTVCPRQFANKASLAEHMQTEHASSNIPNSN